MIMKQKMCSVTSDYKTRCSCTTDESYRPRMCLATTDYRVRCSLSINEVVVTLQTGVVRKKCSLCKMACTLTTSLNRSPTEIK